ncbi:MFS transporter [Serinibacter arcticus]|uniref:MFS transporter n=1 Tax=Serinibacter arcticus TaxID=1655435 RepID=A0A2U1ZXV6_9MICO|nr:MFS transporter [Serinibacter arcticus]PWD51794.1 MFS transporter [Serinibacter arcticus]
MVKRSLHTAPTPSRSATGVALGGTGLVAVTYGVVRYGYGLQLPELAAEYSLSAGTAGLVASGSFAAYCVAAIAAQRLVPRRGARVVLWLAATLAAAGALLVAASWSTPTLALGVLVAGSAAGAASPALVVAVESSVSSSRIGRAQAVVNAGTGVGVAVVGVAVLAAPTMWRPVWVVAAVGALATAAVVDRRARWPERPTSPASPASPARPSGAGPSARTSPSRTTVILLRRPVLAALVAGVGSAAVWTFGRDLVTTTGGLDSRTTAALWVGLGAAAVLGAVSGDAVRLLGLRRSWSLTALATAAATAALALLPGEVVVVAVAAAVFGGAYTALSGVLIAWASERRPEAAGPTTAVLFTALTAGQALGAALTGAAVAHVDVRIAFWGAAALLLLSAAIAPVRGPIDAGTSLDA